MDFFLWSDANSENWDMCGGFFAPDFKAPSLRLFLSENEHSMATHLWFIQCKVCFSSTFKSAFP